MNLRKLKHLGKYIFRNTYMINGKKRSHNKVNLEYFSDVINLGDKLSPVVVEYMLNRKGISIEDKTATSHLLAIGSLLGNSFDATVWGTGVQSFSQVAGIYKWRKRCKYDIRCVRGPLTANALRSFGYECKDKYGDPAVLMPYIYNPENICKQYDVVYVSHFHNKSIPIPKGIKVLDIQTDDYKTFIDELCKAKKVISSSLHGIILSEVYGIPAVFHGENRINEILKYYDWFYSTDRYTVAIANSLEEALKMDPMPLPNVNKLQNNLIETFPYDLWELG